MPELVRFKAGYDLGDQNKTLERVKHIQRKLQKSNPIVWSI